MLKWIIGLGVGGAIVYFVTRSGDSTYVPTVPNSPLVFLPPGAAMSQQA